MQLISVKIARPDGTAKTVSRPITDEVAMNEIAVQNAVQAAVRQERGTLVGFQIIDPARPNVRETLIGPDEEVDDRPRVGVQHEDAVGIIDGEPSGDDPVDQLEDMGTLAALEDMGVDVHPDLAEVIDDMEPTKKRSKK